ncbi:MAG: hypothetical protein WDN06_18985 [Asticcacaulis sp.]
MVDGKPFEITSLREDVETDGRRAVVTYTTDWAKDAGRRDFYLNALYADIDGEVYDPTGHGLDDIDARRVRFIGDARGRVSARITLRILRFFSFQRRVCDRDRPRVADGLRQVEGRDRPAVGRTHLGRDEQDDGTGCAA